MQMRTGGVFALALGGLAALGWHERRALALGAARWWLVPQHDFASDEPSPAPDYDHLSAWAATPRRRADNPTLWAPDGMKRATPHAQAATFFVTPTTYFSREHWNAPLDARDANGRTRYFLSEQASVFNAETSVWAPRYRQATLGTFFRAGPDADLALALAFADVCRAFDAFLERVPDDIPIILAGHSQGARHLLHLLPRVVARIRERLVAAYLVGWPVTDADLARIGLPGAATPRDTGCVLSWQTFLAPADPAEATAYRRAIDETPDLSGQAIGDRPVLCVNPLTGDRSPAPPERNIGMLSDMKLVPGRVGATPGPDGLLLVGPDPGDLQVKLLGGNAHVRDYAFFWGNIRADVTRRMAAFRAERAAAPVAADG